MKIGLMVAMDKEFQQIRNMANSNVIVIKSGMGKVNAAVNATQLIDKHHPDVIISSGCLGGARADMNVLDAVVGSRVVYHDAYYGLEAEEFGRVQGMPKYYEANKELVSIAQSLTYSHTIHTGLIASGEWFVDSLEKMNEIISHFPDAIGVDMESAAIAQTCHIFKVPFLSFRIVSDVPARKDNVADYTNFWDTVSEESFALTKQLINILTDRKPLVNNQ